MNWLVRSFFFWGRFPLMNPAEPDHNSPPPPTRTNPDLIYGLNDRPPLRETLFVATQHVVAVFVGMVTPPLLICNAIGMGSADTAFLVSMSLFISGIGTLIQTNQIGRLGSGLLSIQGTSFMFVAPVVAVVRAGVASGESVPQALGSVFGICLAGAFAALFAGVFIRRAHLVITPLVTGTVILLIGLTLIQVGITSAGGGYSAKHDGTFGSGENLFLAAVVVATIVALNSSRHAVLRMASVVAGLGVGYVAGFFLHRVDLGALGRLPIIMVPRPMHYGLRFDLAFAPPFVFLYLMTVMESVGDITATSLLSNEPISGPVYMRRLQGGVMADGFNSMLAACFNSFPCTTYAQNNGIIQLTGVASRYVGWVVGLMLVVLGLIPSVGGFIQGLPQAALGGATLLMFSMVAIAGIRILASVELNRRSSLILAVSLSIGLGITFDPEILASLPTVAREVLSSGISSGGMCALVLNLVLPQRR
jgi:xanthine permease XanP